jgi:hypothetical protein
VLGRLLETTLVKINNQSDTKPGTHINGMALFYFKSAQ